MPANPLADYLKTRAFPDPGAVAYIASLQSIAQSSPEIARSIVSELEKQRSNIKLIASENYSSLAVQLAMGNLLTDKYAEGSPRHRFYAGNDNVDDIEETAQAEARALFGAEYANVQAHCGADANLMAYWAILTTRVEAPALKAFGESNLYKLEDKQWMELRTALGNQRLLGLNYYSGGHLTHGYRYNLSARMFDIYSYSVRRDTSLLDYDEIAQTSAGSEAAHSPSRLFGLSQEDRLPQDAGHRRLRRGRPDGRHGSFCRPGCGRRFHRGLQPVSPCTRRDNDYAQDPARSARRHGPLHERVRGGPGQILPADDGRPAPSRGGGKGRCPA